MQVLESRTRLSSADLPWLLLICSVREAQSAISSRPSFVSFSLTLREPLPASLTFFDLVIVRKSGLSKVSDWPFRLTLSALLLTLTFSAFFLRIFRWLVSRILMTVLPLARSAPGPAAAAAAVEAEAAVSSATTRTASSR